MTNKVKQLETTMKKMQIELQTKTMICDDQAEQLKNLASKLSYKNADA